MKKIKSVLAAGCCVALLTSGGAFAALGGVITVGEGSKVAAEQVAPDSIGIWGTVISAEEGQIRLDNISGNSFQGEMVLNIIDGESRVLDAVNGFPVALGDLKAGDFIYAYIGPTMTLSLPPITNAQMVICKAPADMKVPEYITITGVTAQEDGSVKISGNNGSSYQVPADCVILPYLTRNMVTIQDIVKGSTCMIWSDGENQANKVVLFAPTMEALQ